MCTEWEMDTVVAAEKQVVAVNDTSTPLDLLCMEGWHIGHCCCPTVIVMTEGASAHASPNPLLTQKHIWQSITGDSFVPTFSRKTPLHCQPLDWSSSVGCIWVFMCRKEICKHTLQNDSYGGRMGTGTHCAGLGWKNSCVPRGWSRQMEHIRHCRCHHSHLCILIWIMSRWGCGASDTEMAWRCQGVFPKIPEKDRVKHWTTSKTSFEQKWESWV